ncbi:peptide deformylase [Desulfonatronospira sp.]|uniref:peptide deformylase n=1 Tax=Desulfonatronospira sp. TaxID=1962951 RepID=UPI0025BD2493|nr:peptide deformylase [Desulfonatronospira sp.]
MSRKIHTYPDKILLQQAGPVEKIDDYIVDLSRDMARLMYENRGIGLAAPQVGESLRVVTVDLSGPDRQEELFTYINPEIISSEEEITTEEGCLSVAGYQSNVRRARKIQIRALNLQGEEVIHQGEDLWAVCLQHEIDHLNGILFIDHISRLKRAMYDKKVKKWLDR